MWADRRPAATRTLEDYVRQAVLPPGVAEFLTDRGDGAIDPLTGSHRPRRWVPLGVNLWTVPAVMRNDVGISMRELVRAALPFRPDRILLANRVGPRWLTFAPP